MFLRESLQVIRAALLVAFVATMALDGEAFDYETMSRHVVDVTMYSTADIDGGSGIVLGDEYVVTNCHVVEPTVGDAPVSIEIRTKVGRGIKTFDGFLDGRVVRQDLCFIRVPGLTSPWPPTLIGSVRGIKMGSRVCAIGHRDAPAESGKHWVSWAWSTSCGVVSRLQTCSAMKTLIPHGSCGAVPDRIIQTDGLFAQGSSGGGLFDEVSGELLGIATYRGSSGSVFALPGDWITRTEKYSNILARTVASAEISPDAVSVIDRIRHYRTRNEAYLALAARQIDDRDPVQAMDTLDRSLRVRDVADLVRYTRLMVQTAKLQRMAGDRDKARDTLARVSAEHSAVRRSDRSLAPSMLYLAKAQSQLGEVARAKATLSKAWRLARSNRRRSPYRRAGLLASLACHQIDVGDEFGATRTRNAFEDALSTINRPLRKKGIERLRGRMERCWRLSGSQPEQEVSR